MKKKQNISDSDLSDWKNYTKNPKDIFDKESTKYKSSFSKKRFRFDLHGYTLEAANAKIAEIIKETSKLNFKEILLITGKGLHSNTDSNVYVSNKYSKLRYSIPEYIKSNMEISFLVKDIIPARLNDGGDGAIIIILNSTIK